MSSCGSRLRINARADVDCPSVFASAHWRNPPELFSTLHQTPARDYTLPRYFFLLALGGQAPETPKAKIQTDVHGAQEPYKRQKKLKRSS